MALKAGQDPRGLPDREFYGFSFDAGMGRFYAGQPVRPHEIFHARARRAAIRAGRTCYRALTREIAKYRNTADRNRHRPRKSKPPSSFGHATTKDTRTRIAPAIITMADSPA